MVDLYVVIREYVVDYEEHKVVLGIFDVDHIDNAVSHYTTVYPNDSIYDEAFKFNELE